MDIVVELGVRPKVLELIEQQLDEDPWPTQASWGMSDSAAAAARQAEAMTAPAVGKPVGPSPEEGAARG